MADNDVTKASAEPISIGRIVGFYAVQGDPPETKMAVPALVSAVNDDGTVTLTVFDPMGPYIKGRVPHQDERGARPVWWNWLPRK